MAVWADVDGKSIQITCPQNFDGIVPPGVYSAIIEFFGCEPIGSDNYEKRIERAENSLDNLRWEYEHLAEDEEKLHDICERCRMARKLEDD